MDLCSGCRFWLNWDSEGSGLGECHRFPPRMATACKSNVEDESATTVRPEGGGWPLTAPDDWCGEFQAVATRETPRAPGRSPSSPGDLGADAAGI